MPRYPVRSLLALLFFTSTNVFAHTVQGRDAAFLKSVAGPHIAPFIYLGAKHMVTGYDHLLFLVGVIFFLYRMRDVATYVTCFAIGHSVTLLAGVLGSVHVNPYMVDALIGLSVVYKAFDNINGFPTLFGFQPNTKLAVLVFGLIHGFGLATKMQEFNLSRNGLVANIVSFNVGVELGQLLALSLILAVMLLWRRSTGFTRHAVLANVLLMIAGFVLMGYQISGYFLGASA
ncbi:MAG: HupE/UreJ family protein [Acidobacteriota bacterium]